ncbi:MAG TPA: hypothetical protein VHT72_00880 [Puia sp.]|nr:hypothetical protein [Puia sp.]
MKKYLLLFIVAVGFSTAAYSQLMVSKMLGKNADNSQLGYGFFTFLDFPLNTENTSIRLELLDMAYYPQKNADVYSPIGYLSIKAGFKYVFSESQAGFYLEPSAGYCRVVNSGAENFTNADSRDGIAMAMEGGYSLAVGQKDNTVNFALKYETDRAGTGFIINSIGFRVGISFHIFRRKDSY